MPQHLPKTILSLCWLLVIGLQDTTLAAETKMTDSADQKLTLEELLRVQLKELPRHVEVSTSTRFMQSAQIAPNATYIVTSQDIQLYQYRTLGDILSTLPGLYVTSDGSFNYLGVRGLGRFGDFNSRLLFLINGVRVNENISDAGFIGADGLLDIESIERVEFASGPGSALYGNNAFFGVVNVITKGTDKLQGWKAKYSLDNQQQQQARLSIGHREANAWEGWLSLSASDWQNMPLFLPIAPEYEQFSNTLRKQEEEQTRRLSAEVKISQWTFLALLHQRERHSAQLLTPQPNVSVSQIRSSADNHLLRATHLYEVQPDWELQTSLTTSRNDFNKWTPFLTPESQRQSFVQQIIGHWRHLDMRLANRSFHDHLILTGVEYQKDTNQQINLGTLGLPFFQSFYSHNERKAIYLQDLWQWHPKHSFVLGARYDKSRRTDSNLHPRLGWIWQYHPDLTVKLMHGSAFRAPNLYEFSANAPWLAPIPKSEEILSSELTLEHFPTKYFNYRMTIFNSKIDDIIEVDLMTALFVNGEPIRSRGVEFAIEQRWQHGIHLKANWSWQQQRLIEQDMLENAPKHLFNLQIDKQLTSELQLGLQFRAMSRRVMPVFVLPGYGVAHLHMRWQASPQAEISLSWQNIADKRYFDQPSVYEFPIEQLGQSLRLSMQWRFEP